MRSIWSYAGLALALLVAAALIVPGFLDWSRYAGLIEAQAEAVTGRDVNIAGDVRISLLPTPKLTLGKLTLANVEGASTPHMLEIASMTAELSLGSLFRGDLEVSRLTVDAPRLWLEETAEGRSNWQFRNGSTGQENAQGDTVADPLQGMPPVTIGEIEITKGWIGFSNLGLGTHYTIDAINALLGADGLAGPYRSKGTASIGGHAAAFTATLGEVSSEKAYPANVAFTFENAELAFRGIVTGRGGDVRFDGAISAAAAADLTPELGALTAGQPVSLTAGLVAAPDGLTLRDIEAEAGAVKMSGNVAATSGSQFVVTAALAVNRIDLTGFETAGIALDREAVVQAVSSLIAGAPDGSYDLVAEQVRLPATGLPTGGGFAVLTDVNLITTVADGAVSVTALDATLAGDTHTQITGALALGNEGPYFSGDVALTSKDPKEFAAWLGSGSVPPVLGAMPLETLDGRGGVFLTPERLGLDRLVLMIDGGRAAGQVSTTFDDRPKVKVSLDMERIALAEGAIPFLDTFVPGRSTDLGFDGDVVLNIASLDVGALHVEDFRLDLTAQDDALTVRELLFRSARGASATLKGASTSAEGEYQATLTAPDVGSLEGLLPLPQHSLEGLAPLSLSANAAWPSSSGEEASRAQTVAVSMIGRIDTVRFESEALLTSGADGLSDAAYNGTALLEADAWQGIVQALAALAGVRGETPANDEAFDVAQGDVPSLTLAVQGQMGAPVAVAAEAALTVLTASVAGTLDLTGDALAYEFDITADASDPVAVAQAAGYTLAGIDHAQVRGDIAFEAENYAVQSASLMMRAGSSSIDADVSGTLFTGGPVPQGAISVVSRALDAGLVAGIVRGDFTSSAPPVADDVPADGTTDSWSTQLLKTDWLTGAALDLTFSGGGVVVGDILFDQVDAKGRLEAGTLTVSDATGRAFGGQVRASGTLAAQDGLTLETSIAANGFDLGEASGVLGYGGFESGTGGFDLSLSGKGLSALALVSSLKGEGGFEARDGAFAGIDLAALSQGIELLERVEDFADLADATLNRGTTPFTSLQGRLAMTAGVLRAPDIQVETTHAKGTTAAFADVGRYALDVETSFDLLEPEAAPPVQIVFSGDMSAMDRTVKSTDLEAYVGRMLIARDIDALGGDSAEELRVILDLPNAADEPTATP